MDVSRVAALAVCLPAYIAVGQDPDRRDAAMACHRPSTRRRWRGRWQSAWRLRCRTAPASFPPAEFSARRESGGSKNLAEARLDYADLAVRKGWPAAGWWQKQETLLSLALAAAALVRRILVFFLWRRRLRHESSRVKSRVRRGPLLPRCPHGALQRVWAREDEKISAEYLYFTRLTSMQRTRSARL